MIDAPRGADVLLGVSDEQAVAAAGADGVIESSGNHFGLASVINGALHGGRVVTGGGYSQPLSNRLYLFGGQVGT